MLHLCCRSNAPLHQNKFQKCCYYCNLIIHHLLQRACGFDDGVTIKLFSSGTTGYISITSLLCPTSLLWNLLTRRWILERYFQNKIYFDSAHISISSRIRVPTKNLNGNAIIKVSDTHDMFLIIEDIFLIPKPCLHYHQIIFTIRAYLHMSHLT